MTARPFRTVTSAPADTEETAPLAPSSEGAATELDDDSRTGTRVQQRDCKVLSRARRESANEAAAILSSVVRARGGCGPEEWARRLSDPGQANGPKRQVVSRWMEPDGPRATLGDVMRLPVDDLDRLLAVLGEWNHGRRNRPSAQPQPVPVAQRGLQIGGVVGQLQAFLGEALADGAIDEREAEVYRRHLRHISDIADDARRDIPHVTN